MKKNQVIDFMDSLENEDEGLDLFSKTYEALSAFLTDFDFLKDSLGLTQQDVADKMGTTQSAISRIASLKTNPFRRTRRWSTTSTRRLSGCCRSRRSGCTATTPRSHR